MQAKDAVGRFGEKVAVTYLEERGWRVLDRNWRGAQGEIDVVALEDGDLVVVEVKTRRGLGYGHPAEAVTRVKLARLGRLAAEWLDAHEVQVRSIRIDVVAVVLRPAGAPVVEHLVGVTP